jgi:hypothetical protein
MSGATWAIFIARTTEDRLKRSRAAQSKHT